MKIALCLDHLIEREYATEVFESVLEICDDVEVFTLVHIPRAVLGRIEHHKINSTYLSHRVKNRDSLWKSSCLIPGAARKLFIPCSFDLVVHISKGLGHGFSHCKEAKMITYLLGNDLKKRRPQSFLEKIFRPFLRSWSESTLSSSTEVLVASTELEKEFSHLNTKVEVLNPFFKVDDYPLFPEGVRKSFSFEYYLINAEGLENEAARELADKLQSLGIKFKFVGDDDHLSIAKYYYPPETFFGKRCAGELSPALSSCRALIDFNTNSSFPKICLATLAGGRPVIVFDNALNRSFLKDRGVIYLKSMNELEKAIGEMDTNHHSFSPEELRGTALCYREIKFKHAFKRHMDRLIVK